MRKTRPDAAWMRLSPEAQTALASEMERKSLADARAWLAEKHGVRMSPSALSRFYSWFHVTRTISESRDIADQIRRDMKAIGGESIDDDGVNKVAQRAFELMALKRQDAKLFLGLQGRRLKDLERDLREARSRIATLEADLQAARNGASNAPPVDPAEVARKLDAALGRGGRR